MTSHWCDFQNANVIMAIGSNNAENHPVSAAWVQDAIAKNNAPYIVVDPRFTRSAALADIYAPIRSGTDIAFFGGMIKYILDNDRWQKEYVENYTNASYLVNPDFGFDDATGLFTGWDGDKKVYEKDTWVYETAEEIPWDVEGAYAWTQDEGVPEFTPLIHRVPAKDPTLTAPNCCFQLLKKHYERYDIDTVVRVTGMPKDKVEQIYDVFTSTGAPEKAGTIFYALGQTQHHYGTQNIRAMAVLQLLLGNVGVAGGGINALRGEANVQGSTDMCVLAPNIPGYLNIPNAGKTPTLRDYLEKETDADGYYSNKPKFLISYLKELYGDYATLENDYAYDMLPKISKPGAMYSHTPVFEEMMAGKIKGYIVFGQNPCNSAANASFVRRAMCNLDWMVSVDLYDTETSSFWRAPDIDPAQCQTTVYSLPAAGHYEKDGSISHSGRWIQWRFEAVPPLGNALSDMKILHKLYMGLKKLYEAEGGPVAEQITKLNWPYETDGEGDVLKVSHALNGYDVSTGKLLKNFTELKADGSTACGNWIYSGFFNNNDAPFDPAQQPTASRIKDDPSGLGLYPQWSFAWPVNRRVLYNRASADMQGKPFNPDAVLVEWDGSKWILNDVPDFVATKTLADGTVEQVPPNNKAFMMAWEQNARLWAPGLADGPFPEHYEPFESPADNKLNGASHSPCIQFAEYESVKQGSRDEFPIIATSYSFTEMWQSGSQTRNLPWLVEVRPEMFIEISKELAEEKGIANGDIVRVWNNRGEIEAPACVTIRLRPFDIDGEKVHEIGVPRHWGWASGHSTGPVANDLTPNVGDANSFIPEYKAFLVNIEKK